MNGEPQIFMSFEWFRTKTCFDTQAKLILTHRQKATRMPYFIPGRPPGPINLLFSLHLFWRGYLRGLARVRTAQEVNFSAGNKAVLLVKLSFAARREHQLVNVIDIPAYVPVPGERWAIEPLWVNFQRMCRYLCFRRAWKCYNSFCCRRPALIS